MFRNGLNIVARVALLLSLVVVLGSCGSGAVGPPPVTDPAKVTILPGADGTPAILYSGLPTTFSITGGTGSYIVSSSNQAIVPVIGNLTGNTLTVIPNPVVVETALTLTARDTSTAAPATVNLVVRPGTVNNTISVTPGSTACSGAICSGGDALVQATLSQGGIPLPARGVRFDVVSGDFRFITSPAGAPETLALSVITTTDETGTARARLRAFNTAQNQAAILQVTDLGSGAYQRTSFFIALTSNAQAGFFTVPTSVTFTGPRADRCASGVSSDVFVFGGNPPYTISNSAPDAFFVTPVLVTSTGGSFRITPSGVCAENATIAITDAAGRTTTFTASNKPGTAPVPTPIALAASPNSVTLNSCTSRPSVFVVGGQGGYRATTTNDAVIATVNGDLVTISRRSGSDALGATGATVAITDGAAIVTVAVTMSGAATGLCP